jgi:predicted SAM-dependent methyltransferase
MPTLATAEALAPVRRLVKRAALRARLALPGPRRIVVGTSGHAPPGWIATDIGSLNLLDEADWRSRFAEGSLDAILAEHVWEHLAPAAGLEAAVRCARYLRPGGRLRVAVPDGLHPDPAYIAAVRPGGTGPGADDHKLLYTYRTLGALLERAGLAVTLLEHFDEAGRFHAAPWRWEDGPVRRSAAHDPRNAGGRLVYTSLIADAVRPR